MKFCLYCGDEKPESEFKVGWHKCKACFAADHAANKERKSATNAAWYAANKEKIAARQAGYREANKEAIAARKAAWYAANKERRVANNAAWYATNKERRAAKSDEWYRSNPEKVLEKGIRRRRTVAGQTPAWADRGAVLAVYRDAKEFRAAGLDVHVDHIVPLKGKLVSGLHNEFNLTVKMAHHNDSKGTRFDPLTFNNDAPLEQAA